MKCDVCDDCGWVCENQPVKAVAGSARLPMLWRQTVGPKCNPSHQRMTPRPAGCRTDFDDSTNSDLHPDQPHQVLEFVQDYQTFHGSGGTGLFRLLVAYFEISSGPF